MDKHDRILEAVEKLCKFCPVCGKELVEKTKEIVFRGRVRNTVDHKACPDGHSELFMDGMDGPDAVFEINKELYKDVE